MDFEIYINNSDFRDKLLREPIPRATLYQEQEQEINNYSPEVYKMVSHCFTNVSSAAALLSADGMFLQYAGPTIRSNYNLVKVAVNQNGNALEFVSPKLLMSSPSIAADLILSARFGYPCEAFRKAVKDENYIFEVCKTMIEIDPTLLDWVSSHMYGIVSYDLYEQKYAELAALRTKTSSARVR